MKFVTELPDPTPEQFVAYITARGWVLDPTFVARESVRGIHPYFVKICEEQASMLNTECLQFSDPRVASSYMRESILSRGIDNLATYEGRTTREVYDDMVRPATKPQTRECSICHGTGIRDYGDGPVPCGMCDGTGQIEDKP